MMAKQKIEIEVDILDGYEFVRYGVPTHGEFVIYPDGAVMRSSGESFGSYVVVRKAWQWPEWLKADCIARAKVDKWYAYAVKPTLGVEAWYTVHGEVCCLTNGMFDFTPPPCDDWTQSLLVRPGVEQ